MTNTDIIIVNLIEAEKISQSKISSIDDAKKTAAVIPVFNEEKDIKKLLIKIKKYAFPILVNDGSTDKTYEMAKTYEITVYCLL